VARAVAHFKGDNGGLSGRNPDPGSDDDRCHGGGKHDRSSTRKKSIGEELETVLAGIYIGGVEGASINDNTFSCKLHFFSQPFCEIRPISDTART
jgi:hypothetical protein